MHSYHGCGSAPHTISIDEEVRSYILERECDFRVCTSCGGPVLLPTTIKPPKATDTEIYIDDRTIYVSIYQVRFLDRIKADMLPHFCMY
ncbi:MAG TPA: hypothetical protein ENN85_05175 [Methanoculleus sp.]|nr:hypothetical protein [Methanoculleus sp.]